MVSQEGDTLDLLIISQVLLKNLDAVHQHLLHLLVGTQVLTAGEGDVMLTSPILYEAELRYNEGRNELALVGDDCHLIDELIHQEQRLHLLRSDIFTIRSLEQILDTLGEVSSPSFR